MMNMMITMTVCAREADSVYDDDDDDDGDGDKPSRV